VCYILRLVSHDVCIFDDDDDDDDVCIFKTRLLKIKINCDFICDNVLCFYNYDYTFECKLFFYYFILYSYTFECRLFIIKEQFYVVDVSNIVRDYLKKERKKTGGVIKNMLL